MRERVERGGVIMGHCTLQLTWNVSIYLCEWKPIHELKLPIHLGPPPPPKSLAGSHQVERLHQLLFTPEGRVPLCRGL